MSANIQMAALLDQLMGANRDGKWDEHMSDRDPVAKMCCVVVYKAL